VARRCRPCLSMTSTAAPLRGTVRFGLDGTEYEIDLNAEHAQQPRTPGSWLSSSDYGRDKPGALWLALTERTLTSSGPTSAPTWYPRDDPRRRR
jgi:hypothetical protein